QRIIRIITSPFLLNCSVAHPHLHSFPTRRSSDLEHPGGRRFNLRAEVAVHGELHRVGIQRRPVVELHPRFEMERQRLAVAVQFTDRKSTRLNSSHDQISYAVFCLKKKKKK